MASIDPAPLLPSSLRARLEAWLRGVLGYALLAACVAAAVSLLTWSNADPSFTRAATAPTRNLLGPPGAVFSDLVIRLFGLAGVFMILPPTFWALQLITRRRLDAARLKLLVAPLAVLLLACAASSLPSIATWPVPYGLGGLLGDQALRATSAMLAALVPGYGVVGAGVVTCVGGMVLLMASLGLSPGDLKLLWQDPSRLRLLFLARWWQRLGGTFDRYGPAETIRHEPMLAMPGGLSAGDRMSAWRAEPSFNRELQLRSDSLLDDSDDDLTVPETQRDAELDTATDTECHDLAKRFAPERDAAPAVRIPRFLLRHARQLESAGSRASEAAGEAERPSCRPDGSPGRASRLAGSPTAGKGKVARKPVWPGSVPPPARRLPAGQPAHNKRRRATDDELYGRAVAIVRADRKASTEHLQERLGIGYMRAADLLDRMEQEGILGTPTRHGTRPILGRPPRWRVV